MKFLKKFFLILGMVTFFQTQAFAFPVHANVFWNRGQATASAYNHFGRPIICSGHAVGVTMSGPRLFSYMNGAIIYPGTYGNIFVYTNNYNPFIGAQAFLNCNWL